MKTIITTVVATIISTAAAADISNNQALSQCLKTQKYQQQDFNSFDFTKAASCHHKTVAANVQTENDKLTALLKEKPYYGGDGSGWYKSVETYGTKSIR